MSLTSKQRADIMKRRDEKIAQAEADHAAALDAASRAAPNASNRNRIAAKFAEAKAAAEREAADAIASETPVPAQERNNMTPQQMYARLEQNAAIVAAFGEEMRAAAEEYDTALSAAIESGDLTSEARQNMRSRYIERTNAAENVAKTALMALDNGE